MSNVTPLGKARTGLGAPRLNVTKQPDGTWTYYCVVCRFESTGHKRQVDGIQARKDHMAEIKELKRRWAFNDTFDTADLLRLKRHQESYR